MVQPNFDLLLILQIRLVEKSIEDIKALNNNFIQELVIYINANISSPDLTVETIANDLFLSRSQLYRKTKSITGITVNEFIKKVRLEEAKKIIKIGDKKIAEVSHDVGFSSPSYFTKCFKDEYGKTPSEIR